MKQITVTIDDDVLEKIDKMAQQRNISQEILIREALTRYAVEYEADNPAMNPLLGLIGLAGEYAVPTDVSNGKDEDMLMEGIGGKNPFLDLIGIFDSGEPTDVSNGKDEDMLMEGIHRPNTT